MNQNSFFLHTINQEAIQSWADSHLQNTLPGKDIVTKTTQPFLKSTYELYVHICHYEVVSRKFSKSFVHFIT